MIGYKAFNDDLTCRGFQYEIGETYELHDEPIPCIKGFHFCKTIADTYRFYDTGSRICRIEALGEIKTDDNIKYCTNKIRIIEEITDPILRHCNVDGSVDGYCNVGHGNYGIRNIENENYGNRNVGSSNAGDYNVGHNNIGSKNAGSENLGWFNMSCSNIGNRNNGSGNIGDGNCGDYNIGNCNLGYWNYTSHSFGCFNTAPSQFMMFNKPTNWTFKDWRNSNASTILSRCPFPLEWVELQEMTIEELEQYPKSKVTKGFLRKVDYKKARQEWWDEILNEWERNIVKAMPNFDAEIFEECTGIKV